MPRGKSKASLELIRAAHEIAERNHPLTIRGICYKLFALYELIPDMSTNRQCVNMLRPTEQSLVTTGVKAGG